jgi:hypothetical protein
MATSKKTMFLDLLQLNALKFYTTSNKPIPSSLVLTASGNGQTYFTSISSLIGYSFQNVFTPGQNILSANSTNTTLTVSSLSSELILSTDNISTILYIGIPSLTSTITSTINSVQASTMFNLLNYPNIVSSVYYKGNTGKLPISTLATNAILTNSGSGIFSSFQYNFSSFTKYINPNGSSRMFIDYYPSMTFGTVMTPSSISSTTLYPEGNSSIKSVLSLSSHFMYVNSTGSNVPLIKSGIQQYIPITSLYPYGVSSFINPRITSNTFIQPLKMEFDTSLTNSNISIVHYISDGIGSIKTSLGNDVFRTGLETSTMVINNNINDRNIVFTTIINSGNQY